MKFKSQTVVLGSLIALGVIIGITIWYAAKPRTASSNVASPSPSPTAFIRVDRTVSGTNWHYKINPIYESKFNIKVESTTDNRNRSTLRISGQGCNAMSAEVSTTKSDDSSASTQIAGQTYYLSGPTSTLMACVDERQSYDALLSNEITSIFQSLTP